MLRLNSRRLQAYGRFALLRVEEAWEILADGLSNFFRNGSLNQSAAIALYALLSIIPLFVLTVIAAGRLLGAYQDIQGQIIGIIKSFHPYFDGDLLAQLGQIEGKSHVLGWIGIASLIWFSSMIFGAMETALNITFRAESHRNILVSKLLAFSMIPLGWVAGLTSVLLTYVATLLSGQVSFVEGHVLNFELPLRLVLRYIVPFLVSVLFATIVFKVIPSKRIRWRTALAGSGLFAILIEMVKHVFTWYVANHTRYNAIFGSLETVVILVIWVYYMALIFLFCAELMSSYERSDLLLIEHVLMKRRSRTGRQRMFRKFGRAFPEGAIVCQEGDRSQEMYFILSGTIRLEKKAGLTAETLAELGPGDHFGEMAALTGVPRAATAIAATDCDVAVIDGQVFHRLLRESDDLAIHLLKEFSERLRRTNESLDSLSQSWIRVTTLLLLLRGGIRLEEIPQMIAERTRKSPQDIHEVLRSLEEQGVLVLQDGELRSFDKTRAWDQLHGLVDAGRITP